MSQSSPRRRTTIAVTRVGVPAWMPVSVGIIRVDGQRAGLLVGGKTRLLYVVPGRRVVTVKLGPAWSGSMGLDLAPGEHAEVVCGVSAAPAGEGARRPTGVGRIALGATLLVLGLAMLALPALYLASPVVRGAVFRVVYALPVLDRFVLSFSRYLPAVAAIPLACLALAPLLIGFGARLYLQRAREVWLARKPAVAVEAPPALRSPLDPTPDDPPPGPITNQCVIAAQEARRATAGLRRPDDEAAEAPESPATAGESTPGGPPAAG